MPSALVHVKLSENLAQFAIACAKLLPKKFKIKVKQSNLVIFKNESRKYLMSPSNVSDKAMSSFFFCFLCKETHYKTNSPCLRFFGVEIQKQTILQ